MRPSYSHLSKLELRKIIREAREQLESSENSAELFRDSISKFIAEIGANQPVTCVAAYLAYGTEPNLNSFISSALEQGVQVLLPVSNADHSLTWVNWLGTETKPGIFNFAEPVGETADLSQAAIVFVPALAADISGNRLGKGKGYYDRSLKDYSGITAAVVFESELFEDLPIEDHDQKVDYVITQRSITATT